MNKIRAVVAGILVVAAIPAEAQSPDSASVPARDTGVARPAFQLKMVGRIQTLYQYTAPERDGAPSGAIPSDTSLFKVHRARLGFSGWVHDPRLEFELQADFAGASALLRRAFANYRLRGEAAQLRAGRFVVPFGRQQLTSVFSQPTVDRVSLADNFGRGHDDGVMVWGLPAAGRVEYYAGVFNGDGFNRNTQQDASNLWVARGVWAPLGRVAYTGTAWGDTRVPRLAVGASVSRNQGWLYEVNGKTGMQGPSRECAGGSCTDDWGDDAAIRSAAVDATLRWRGTSWMAEAFRRDVSPLEDTLPELRATGWYAQGTSFVVARRVEVGGRYARYLPGGSRVTEVNPFAVAYLRGNEVKLMSDLAAIRTSGPEASRTTRRARVSLLVTF